MHYYQHHIGDFIRDTSRLNDHQCMTYIRLIWIYYETEKPLPNDIPLLAFKVGSDKDTVEMLLQCYFYANALHWHHKRIDSDLEEYKNKSEKARKSAKSRWNNANGMRTHSEGNANQEPITNNHKPDIKENLIKENSEKFELSSPKDNASLPAQLNDQRKSVSRKSKLPKDWVLRKDQGEWALKERPDLYAEDIRKIAEQFRDHWIAKGECRADWDATWRNWIRNDKKYSKTNGNHYGKPKFDAAQQAIENLRRFRDANPNGFDFGDGNDPL